MGHNQSLGSRKMREQLAAIWIYGRYEDFRLEANNLCNNEEMHCVKEKIRIIT